MFNQKLITRVIMIIMDYLKKISKTFVFFNIISLKPTGVFNLPSDTTPRLLIKNNFAVSIRFITPNREFKLIIVVSRLNVHHSPTKNYIDE